MKKYYAVQILPEEYPENPRDDMDCLGTLYTWHRNYTLGGKEDENHQTPPEDLQFWVFEKFIAEHNLRYVPLVNPQLNHFDPEFENYMIDYDALYVDNGNDWEEPTAEQESIFRKLVDSWMLENLCILPVYMYDHSGITLSTGPFSCPWDSGQVGFIYVTKEKCDKEQVDFAKAEDYLKGEIATLDQYVTGDIWCIDIQQLVIFEDYEFTEDGKVELDEDDLEDHFNGHYTVHHEDDDCKIYLVDNIPSETDDPVWEYRDSCGCIYGYDEAKSQILYVLGIK